MGIGGIYAIGRAGCGDGFDGLVGLEKALVGCKLTISFPGESGWAGE